MRDTLNQFIYYRKSNNDFSYAIKKINVEKIFKIMRKSLFNYSFYSHFEMRN
jgi:hypothetical protein